MAYKHLKCPKSEHSNIINCVMGVITSDDILLIGIVNPSMVNNTL